MKQRFLSYLFLGLFFILFSPFLNAQIEIIHSGAVDEDGTRIRQLNQELINLSNSFSSTNIPYPLGLWSDDPSNFPSLLAVEEGITRWESESPTFLPFIALHYKGEDFQVISTPLELTEDAALTLLAFSKPNTKGYQIVFVQLLLEIGGATSVVVLSEKGEILLRGKMKPNQAIWVAGMKSTNTTLNSCLSTNFKTFHTPITDENWSNLIHRIAGLIGQCLY